MSKTASKDMEASKDGRYVGTPHNDYNDLVIPPDFAELGRPLPPPINLETFNPEPLTAEAIAVAVVDELERRGLTLRKDSASD